MLLYKSREAKPIPYELSLICLILALFLVHTALFTTVALLDRVWWQLNLGLSWEGVLQGKIWQLFTHALLHAGWLHLIVNLCMLWFVGSKVMMILGRKKAFEVVIAGVLLGGLLHLLASMVMIFTGYGESCLVGISGACFAMLLALIVISPHARLRFIPVSSKNLGLGVVIAEVAMLLLHPGLGLPFFSAIGDQLVLSGAGGLFRISHACHLGGAIAGWWVARRILEPFATSQK
ncbi:MAG: rhomboid family intramembrane serine protease [Akkermansiaceae bacterium]